MAYSVNWVTKIITIPASDLTLVSGTRYSLSMSDFLIETRRLEAAFSEGLWAPQVLDHTNPKPDFAGSDYAGFDEVINGYTVTFSAPATRVDLVGSNNNVVDVLNATGISVVPSNSAGLQLVVVEHGVSGLTAAESAALLQNTSDLTAVASDVAQIQIDIGAINTSTATIDGNVATIQTDVGAIKLDISAMQGDLGFVHQMERGKWEIITTPGPDFGKMIFFAADGITPMRTFQLEDAAGNPVPIDPVRRVPL